MFLYLNTLTTMSEESGFKGLIMTQRDTKYCKVGPRGPHDSYEGLKNIDEKSVRVFERIYYQQSSSTFMLFLLSPCS
jgi:hypothetical protein